MATCNMCKQREATISCTIENVGRKDLCKECHQAIPPKKRRTHIIWRGLKSAQHPIEEEFNREMHKLTRNMQKDYM